MRAALCVSFAPGTFVLGALGRVEGLREILVGEHTIVVSGLEGL